MNKIFPISALLLIFSCNPQHTGEKKQPVEKNTSVNNVTPNSSSTNAREITTQTGKTIVVAETHPKGMSLSDISVCFKGDSASTLKIFDKDQISKVFSADLDGNGFDEVYVITSAAGSGSYGNVHGFASNKDKSLSMIYMPEMEKKDLEKGGLLEGYEGHDLFEINGKQLIRTYPSGKQTRTIQYQLQQSETGYTLKPVSSKTE